MPKSKEPFAMFAAQFPGKLRFSANLRLQKLSNLKFNQ